ncbi:MAG: MMPL family transporter [Deltaproteobacteria bacterium]|nr:MMPL family transporter [Deltaproteobacteria bacterium]
MAPPAPSPPRARRRDRIEAVFRRWGLPRLQFDLSDKGFLREDDPVRVTYDAFNRQFGRDSTVLVAIESEEVFSLDFLARLRALHEEFEDLPQIEDITSLVNARNTYGLEDELVVENLLEDWPGDSTELAELRETVLANPLYIDQLISADARLTTIVLQLDRYSSLGRAGDDLAGFEDDGEAALLTQEEEQRIAATILKVAARHAAPGFRIFATGGSVFELYLFEQMQRDIMVSILLSMLVIGLLLYVLFRRVSGVVLPLGVVILALLSATGSMAAMGVPVTLPIQILPAFLLAVGVCGAVHILTLVYRELDSGRSREEAIVAALAHSGLPVAMAGLTTAGGLTSFASSSLLPVAHFGVFGPIGVLFSLVFALMLLPALLTVVPLRKRMQGAEDTRALLSDRVLRAFGSAAVARPWWIVAATVALVTVAAVGAARLRFSHHPMRWLPEESAVRVATDRINRGLGGASSLEVLLETPGVENGLQDPEILARLDELRRFSLSLEVNGLAVANTISIADILKEVHQALNENRPEFYAVPADPQLVAQELLLFENSGSDDLEDVIDSQFSLASFSLRIPWVDAVDSMPLFDAVEKKFNEKLGDRVEVTLTGGEAVFSRTLVAVTQSMARSYVLALLIVTPLMILLIGTVRGCLISMIPNLTPILLTLGLAGWLDLRIDFSSMMIGAIVLGIAVDDTIHFMHVFQRYCRENGDAREAVRRTLATTGRAILFTSIVLCAGFASFASSSMANLVTTAILTCFAIAAAFVADVLLAPALMVLVSPRVTGVVERTFMNNPG